MARERTRRSSPCCQMVVSGTLPENFRRRMAGSSGGTPSRKACRVASCRAIFSDGMDTTGLAGPLPGNAQIQTTVDFLTQGSGVRFTTGDIQDDRYRQSFEIDRHIPGSPGAQG